jgi:hypothetical protein
MHDLEIESPILNDISNSFRTLSSRFKIISFYELESMGPFRKRVTQTSPALTECKGYAADEFRTDCTRRLCFTRSSKRGAYSHQC